MEARTRKPPAVRLRPSQRMIQYVSGNLFTSPAQTLVNTVNTEGVMGKGIALTFKRLFPAMFREYQELCAERKLRIGSLHVFRAPPKLIVNFPSKTTWRRPSKPEYIEAGLQSFAAHYDKMGVRSAAFPPLGCGNGELNFERDVQPLMEQYLSPLPIPIYIYPPLLKVSRPEHQDIAEMRRWLKAEQRVSPFAALWSDLGELLQHRNRFSTLAEGVPFEAEWIADAAGERIRISVSGKHHEFQRDEVEELWAELRHHLVLTARSFVSHKKSASYLLPVLASLPYLEPIEIGQTYDDWRSSPTHGVRLRPVDDAETDQLAIS
jgi:O-acetyl-ADP-ribose deacetylase (regulator of RNase III)